MASLRSSYIDFMTEYEHLGHMELIPTAELTAASSHNLPHHAVVKQDGRKKLRMAFNVSQATYNSTSLNDYL